MSEITKEDGLFPIAEITSNALKVLQGRYLKVTGKDKQGNNIYEHPSEMFWRVAHTVAQADRQYGVNEFQVVKTRKQFFRIMESLCFLPNSPALRGAGRELGQLAACFVIPVPDNLEGIFDAVKLGGLVHKTGGGTGYSFSRLRPKGDVVSSTGNVASGPISFMKLFATATREITQGGVRIGANMAVLHVSHPDIMEFVECKSGSFDFSNFNISVAISDAFMHAVGKNEDWPLINPRNNEIVKVIKATELWEKIIQNAWQRGDPGLLFIDRIVETNPTPEEEIEATNPCVTGDTLIAVADGRPPIFIKQLAEEGKDIPVYCKDDKGEVVVGMGRNPRRTGKLADIYRITFDGGNEKGGYAYIDATHDHKFILNSGEEITAIDLDKGMKMSSFFIGIEAELRMVPYKVIKVERVGKEDVYNLTVDEFHNYGVVLNYTARNRNEYLMGKGYGSGIVIRNCGETALLPYETCVLGSINLAKMIKVEEDSEDYLNWAGSIILTDPRAGEFARKRGKRRIDWDKLKETVRIGIHFLDNVIDCNTYIDPKLEEMTKKNRKIGLGVMGWADMLIQLGIPYDSEGAVSLGEEVMAFIEQEADKRSVELAEERGVFPNFEHSIYNTEGELRVRNAVRTVIAPTGTIGIIAGCNGGIEPLFSVVYRRRTLYNQEGATESLLVVNEWFEEAAKERGFYSEKLMERIEKEGSLYNIPEIPEDIKRIFVTAHDISPEYHIKMQAAFQRHTGNAVSKTINLPEKATEFEVERAFWNAFQERCKGITVYRDNSLALQVLSATSKEEKSQVKELTPRKRAEVTKGETRMIRTGCGKLYITINKDEEGLCEVFARMGKTGGCVSAQSEGIGRLVSLALRSGVDVKAIIKQLKGIRCPSPLWSEGKDKSILSCPDAIGKALELYLQGNGEAGSKIDLDCNPGNCPACPECGSMVEFVEGCVICKNCGYSQCS